MHSVAGQEVYMNSAALARLDSDHATDGDGGEDRRIAPEPGPLRILLAEHNHHLRRLIALVLRRDGHFVVEASDGSRLLDVVASLLIDHRRLHYDLIVSEQRLPGIQGLSVLSALRTAGDPTPFVLMTLDPEVKAQAAVLGAVVLERPYDVEAIRTAIAAR
jgi:CheY-like chemotaxis protein